MARMLYSERMAYARMTRRQRVRHLVIRTAWHVVADWAVTHDNMVATALCHSWQEYRRTW